MTLDSNTILRKVLQSRMQSTPAAILPTQDQQAPPASVAPPTKAVVTQAPREEPAKEVLTSAISKAQTSIHDRLSVTREDFRRHRSRSRDVERRDDREPRRRSRSRRHSRSRERRRPSRSRSRDRYRKRYRSRSRSRTPHPPPPSDAVPPGPPPTGPPPPPPESRSRSRGIVREGEREISGDRHKDMDRDRERYRPRSRSRDRRPRSRSRDSHYSRGSRYSRPSRPDFDRYNNRRGRDDDCIPSETIDSRRPRRRTPPRPPMRSLDDELARLDRTVRVKDVAPNVTDHQLKRFFEGELIGEVASSKVVRDHKTGISKGVAYVEFVEIESVSKALRLTGKHLAGVPIYVDRTDTERSLLMHTLPASGIGAAPQRENPTRKLFVGNIDMKIKEEQLLDIFIQFGSIESLELQKDHTGQSKGIAFVTYKKQFDAKKAMETMNGFQLVGKPLSCNYITEKVVNDHMSVETDGEVQRVSRADLMAKLARNDPIIANAVPIYSKCCVLSNMFDPAEENEDGWEKEIEEDVVSECSKFGKVELCKVDKESADGKVYLQFESAESTKSCINALNGRWFAKKQISAKIVSAAQFKMIGIKA